MQQSESKIALLIDADNAPASKIDAILSEIAKYGVANIRKAYGNWKNPMLKGWEDCFANQASFDSRNYGYPKLSGLFEAIDLFEVQRKDKVIYVRSKQKNSNIQDK
jgi:uncharacterized LabA/DUF88 family protein